MLKAKVAIVGRPNVGKSTLLNKLVGRRIALVTDLPGLTRDRRYEQVEKLGAHFTFIDTAGLEEGEKGLAERLNKISEEAFTEADVILLVIDGVVGVTGADQTIARKLRKAGKPVLVVVNKMDVRKAQAGFDEAGSLGWPKQGVSAEHNDGLPDLWRTLLEYTHDDSVPEAASTTITEKKPLKIAIVGRPNAGKSTLVNHLLGHDRMLTGPEAGLTRESISSSLIWKGTPVELVDTAGLRKKAKITAHAEKISASSSINAIEEADVVVLLMDARQPFEHQDKTLAAYAVDHGKPLILALNKWDLVDKKEALLKEMTFLAEEGLSQVKDIPIVTLSAQKGAGVDALLAPIKKVYEAWHSEIGTGELNRWLQAMLEIQPPPRRRNRAIKIKYMTQIATRPPTFSLWVNMPDEVPDSYMRFLSNQLRAAYNLYGIVLRFKFKGGDNPYAGKRKKDND